MSETIKTLELVDNTVIADRDISVNGTIDAIDVNQVDGAIMTVESDSDGEYLGQVTIYPQNLELAIEDPKVITSVSRGGDLNYTTDARFDHIRRKIWIADTGNQRVIKLDRDTYATDLILNDFIYYPHSIVVNFNIGGVFVKGYTNLSQTENVIYYLKRSGEEIANFVFDTDDSASSSSSSSESVDSSSSSSGEYSDSESSSSSSSGVIILPDVPSSRSMAFDYVRSRLWWIDGSKVYLLDVRSSQIKTFDLASEGLNSGLTVDIDLSTGNAFIVIKDNLSQWFIAQMNRDNNKYLGRIGVV